MKISRFTFFLFSALALAGCKTDLTKVTDAQLLSLLADVSQFSAAFNTDEDNIPPAQITPRMKECFTLLSGTNAEIYKDLPEDMIGIVKTDCRKDLDLRLKDQSRNDTQLALDDFMRADLAERVFTLADTQQAALTVWIAEERAAEEARLEQKRVEQEQNKIAQDNELRAKISSDLASRIVEVETMLGAVQERRAKIVGLCETLTALHADLKSKRPKMNNPQKNTLVFLITPVDSDCKVRNGGGPFDPEKILPYEIEQVESALTALRAFEIPKRNIPAYTTLPALPDPNLEGIDRQIHRIEAGIADHRTLMAEL